MYCKADVLSEPSAIPFRKNRCDQSKRLQWHKRCGTHSGSHAGNMMWSCWWRTRIRYATQAEMNISLTRQSERQWKPRAETMSEGLSESRMPECHQFHWTATGDLAPVLNIDFKLGPGTRWIVCDWLEERFNQPPQTRIVAGNQCDPD